MNLVEFLDQSALQTPDAAAIIDHPTAAPRVTSFANLRTRSAQLATLFARAGVHAGDGIVILVPMSAELYAVIAAALRLGAVPVFIAPEQADVQLARCRGTIPLRAFVGTPMACLFRLLHPPLREIKAVFVTQGWMPGARSIGPASVLPPLARPVTGLADAPAMLTFTAGSTGIGKGVMRSHRLLQATQEILLRKLVLRPGSVNVATMPALVMANVAQGVTSLIPPGDLRSPAKVDPARLASTVSRWHAESLLASPSLVERLSAHCLASGQHLDTLRAVFMGGAPVFLPVMERASRIAPHASVTALYGSTEAEPIALIRLDEISAADRAATAHGAGLPAGKPIEEIKLAILGDHWGRPLGRLSAEAYRSMVKRAGETGEIVVCGPHVSPAYLGGLGDAENKFHLGSEVWHRTGDSGRLDEHGRLWLTGRCAARVGEAPGAVYPLMVEAALAGHPFIASAAFVGHRGRRLLVVSLAPGADKSRLEPLVKLLPWAGIEQIVCLPTIPVDRRHNAKTDYPRLQRELDCRAPPSTA